MTDPATVIAIFAPFLIVGACIGWLIASFRH
jgi:hypothetical protein